MSSNINSLYKREEFLTETRVNRASLVVALLFFVLTLSINIFKVRAVGDPTTLSDYIGIGIFFFYNLILFFILRRNIYHGIIKYITISVAVTTVTLILYGYHFGIDWIHTIRADTVAAYFFAIIVGGYYRNPRLPIFAAGLVCIEYLMLYMMAMNDGIVIHLKTETFRDNIVTWDTFAVYVILFIGSGFLMSLNTVRQKALLTQLAQSSSRADFLENYDQLTKLPNIELFKDDLKGQIIRADSRKQIFALMCLGIDNFKNINRLHGQSSGDFLLHESGARISSTFREGDRIYRFRGDKFLILFTDISNNYDVVDLIKKTREIFNEPFKISDTELFLSFSGGICTYPDDGRSPDELIRNAEAAMYNAKKIGANKYILFNHEEQEQLEENTKLEKELELALHRNEFRLVFQPKTDVSGGIRGMECLLRWENSSRGSIRPDIFIPIAERTGLIIPIGYKVLSMCCSQIRKWEDSGISPVPITVNVSPVQLSEVNFVRNFLRIIREFNIEPGWLGLEVTESSIMENEAGCIEKLTELRNSGMTISIDDFGKGYSSLSRLGSYPLDTLKIDKSFADNLPASVTSSCLVRSIIDLGQNLGYNIVAEGVERIEQINFLKDYGCSTFQGYYFYKPMSADKLLTILKDNKADKPAEEASPTVE